MTEQNETNRNALLSSKKMKAFLNRKSDGYAILQLRKIPEALCEYFMSMKRLKRMGLTPNISHYKLVYAASLPPFSDRDKILEGLFAKFNVDRPVGFRGHSMSVSDIVVLKVGGDISSHYVDDFGFTELPGFIVP